MVELALPVNTVLLHPRAPVQRVAFAEWQEITPLFWGLDAACRLPAEEF